MGGSGAGGSGGWEDLEQEDLGQGEGRERIEQYILFA